MWLAAATGNRYGTQIVTKSSDIQVLSHKRRLWPAARIAENRLRGQLAAMARGRSVMIAAHSVLARLQAGLYLIVKY
jgi:hypothetical protein